MLVERAGLLVATGFSTTYLVVQKAPFRLWLGGWFRRSKPFIDWQGWEKTKANVPEPFNIGARKLPDLNILGYDLVNTCYACPEQYDIRRNGETVGYARLRHGWFYVAVNAASDSYLYETNEPEGDGIFEPAERERFLTEGIAALDQFYKLGIAPPAAPAAVERPT